LSRKKIPPNLPLQRETFYSPPLFEKGGKGGFLNKRQLRIQFSKVKLTLTALVQPMVYLTSGYRLADIIHAIMQVKESQVKESL
jgi:hypothetical protein